MSLLFAPKFRYRDIIINIESKEHFEVRIVMDACIQNGVKGYCVDYLDGTCDWINLCDENKWRKIGEVTNDVEPWFKKDIDSVAEITVLTMTDNSGVSTVAAYRTRNQCLNQVRKEFRLSNENFDKKTEDDYIKKLDENEFIETGKMKYRIDTTYV